ncbi:hypothetical protein [Actinacidiphila sp. ITFR-21]|uniref:hypothetical protein n=1 Tax=Actinacidiphila sp. ITFR-21 TaxID=3075199 RepID=UPI00288AC552|nr:hypothetical protein [Streptomyces sp. ITFR-21]WNI15896.1 hypothetical protein RLT57_10435 [Streptomyces sp. ITFR-21]
MPPFPPIHAGGRGGRRLLRRAVRHRRKPLAVGLVMTAAALAASAAHGAAPRPAAVTPRGPARPVATRHATPEVLVRAPVRIADAAVVDLLHPGDRVDVLAGARVVAAGVTVLAVPEAVGVPPAATVAPDPTGPGGALIVLAVPRRTAASLSGAAASSALAVTLC